MFVSSITAPFNDMQTPKFKAQLTNAFFYRQSNVRWFLPALDYCQARGNQIESLRFSSDNSRKLPLLKLPSCKSGER